MDKKQISYSTFCEHPQALLNENLTWFCLLRIYYIKLLCMFEQIETIMEYYSSTKHLVSLRKARRTFFTKENRSLAPTDCPYPMMIL